MDISIAFDPASMAKLDKMLHVEFGTVYGPAMSQSLDLLESYAVDFMWANFKAPTGQLSGAFIQTITPGMDMITGELANPLPYAWRANSGFHGADSLGRVYDQNGIEYMENTHDSQQDAVFALFVQATQFKLATLGVL